MNSSEQPWPFAEKLFGTYLNVLEYYMLESLPVRRDKLKWLSQEYIVNAKITHYSSNL